MKIIFFITNPQRMAGSNRTLFEIIKGLEEGIQTTVLFSGPGLAPDFFKKENIHVVINQPKGVILNSYGKLALQLSFFQKVLTFFKEYFPYAKSLYLLLKKSDVDIVHCNDIRSLFIIGPVAKILGKKIVLHIHTEFFCPKKTWFILRFLPDVIITVSQFIKDNLDKYSQKKAHRVYNGIRDCKEESETIPYLEGLKQQGVVVVGCVASLIPFKGIHYLIDAANFLKEKRISNVVFVSIGPFFPEHEYYYNWIEEKIGSYQLDNFMLTGSQENPYKFYNCMDICVLPSVSKDLIIIGDKKIDVQGNEGFPTTNLEAMLFEKPIVATRISGTPEQVIHNVTGYLVEPKDVVSLSEKLIALIKDKSLRVEMGRMGRNKVLKDFSVFECTSQFTKVLHNL